MTSSTTTGPGSVPPKNGSIGETNEAYKLGVNFILYGLTH